MLSDFIYDILRWIKNKGGVTSVDFVLTTRCTLKCKDCSALMQYFEKPEDENIDEQLTALNTLINTIQTRNVNIIGGEPFYCKNSLSQVNEFIGESIAKRKIRTASYITNGTVLPDDDCLDQISKYGIGISFSDYGVKSKHLKEFVDICKQKAIRYVIRSEDNVWVDDGRLMEYSNGKWFLKKQYLNCHSRRYCLTLSRGRLYHCERQARGIALKAVPELKGEYIDLVRGVEGPDIRKKLQHFAYSRKYISTCRFCNRLDGEIIPKAVQIREPLKYSKVE